MRSRLLELTFSKGWLYSFQRRHNFKSRRTQGEAGTACAASVERGRIALRARIFDYDAKDAYNLDETALYYCKPPTETIFTDPISRRKSDKKRFPVALAANADGRKNLLLLFVGSAVKPRCFGRQSGDHHAVQYKNTNKGCSWAALLRIAPRTFSKSKVKIEMILPNTTSVLQPMDAGVIACLKAYFHRSQGFHAVDVEDSVIDDEEKSTKDLYEVDVRPAGYALVP
uniref:Putative CENPB/ARS binding proteinlike protein n=1 Tax=Albugo laibachii Nc14 TaxID=890382 RepID=F0WA85_9STRA|nr:putative CENPB/ARS binding proteinlike protein [Albugo laibachii Nc14]|eukprot:CCA18055.1 putative CENPB/ARS binding proteinlike protein [Albugo laibachii Nc14]